MNAPNNEYVTNSSIAGKRTNRAPLGTESPRKVPDHQRSTQETAQEDTQVPHPGPGAPESESNGTVSCDD